MYHVWSAAGQPHIPDPVTAVLVGSRQASFGISEGTEPTFLASHVLMPVQSYVPLAAKERHKYFLITVKETISSKGFWQW